MAEIIFTFNGQKTTIQCTNEEKMSDIFKKYESKTKIDINSVFFLYNGDIIKEELTFNDLANKDDSQTKKINILVCNQNCIETNENEGIIRSKEIICPKCYENCLIEIKDYKIKLYGCKNDHSISYISLTDFDKTQYINESNIVCDNCKKINKFEAYKKQFFKCLTCGQNLCPLCNTGHNKSHQIIDYDKKNYICNIHNDLYISYCEKCKNNLCMLCRKSHNNKKHKIIDYSNMIENKNEIKENLNEFKKKIDTLNNQIKRIIAILNIVSKNINEFYKIQYDIVNNYELQNKNYEILKNINIIKKNIKFNDIDEIIKEDKIENKIQKIIKIYDKLETRRIPNLALLAGRPIIYPSFLSLPLSVKLKMLFS
jgi:hypothetical protein